MGIKKEKLLEFEGEYLAFLTSASEFLEGTSDNRFFAGKDHLDIDINILAQPMKNYDLLDIIDEEKVKVFNKENK